MVKRTMKKSIQQAMDSGAKGVKIRCRGRLDGAEIARRETYMVGSIPLHTLRAYIDYGFTEALTTYGLIGIKVWVYMGENKPVEDKEVKETKTENVVPHDNKQ
jgi:small subunit ribosomal protein S3